MRLDGDAALALEIHGVEHLRLHLARLESAGELEEAICQRRLAMVDVRDDREVPNVGLIHEDAIRKLYRLERQPLGLSRTTATHHGATETPRPRGDIIRDKFRHTMSLSAGVRLGPDEIVALLAREAWARCIARATRLGRDVAVKVLPAAFTADPDRLQRFEQEARAAAALNHPNILAVYDLGQHEGAPFIVSELLEGESLRDV